VLINDIVNRVNKKLAGELLAYFEMKDYLDDVIDDINDRLGATYPAFSELDSSVSEYDFFDDRWIRQVIVFGAAWYFFMADEEGISSAEGYRKVYFNNLNSMKRTLIMDVPLEYRQGYDENGEKIDEDGPSRGTITDKREGSLENVSWTL
jgi:hypothetical protein